MTLFLDYERYDRSNNDDYRNRSYIRTFKTKYGVLNIKMPRDRLGRFYSSLLPKYRRHDYSTDDSFDMGLSNQDISSIITHLCGARYFSNITDKCIENIDKFKSRQLSKLFIQMQHSWPYEEILSQKKQCI